MLLRNHPLMSYRGLRSWPPHWTWTGGVKNMHPQGEVGILREVLNISPADRCFLHITYEASQYVGCLLIEDPTSCYQIAKVPAQLLQSFHCRNRQFRPAYFLKFQPRSKNRDTRPPVSEHPGFLTAASSLLRKLTM